MKDIPMELKQIIVEETVRELGDIFPTGGCESLMDCFTVHDNSVLLWYNNHEGTTKLIRKPLPN